LETFEPTGRGKLRKKLKLYIFLDAPYGLAKFHVGESQCFGTSGIHFYLNKKAIGTPLPPPLRCLMPSPIASFIGVHVFMCILRGAYNRTKQI